MVCTVYVWVLLFLEPHKSACLLELMRSLLEMDWSLKAKYGPLSCLVRALGASSFLDHCNNLPQLLIDAVQDQTTACHVCIFLQFAKFSLGN